jgi:hypothetical protein
MEAENKNKRYFVIIFKLLILAAFVYGLILIIGFFSIKYGFTNTQGKVDENNESFKQSVEKSDRIAELEKEKNDTLLQEKLQDDANRELEKIKNINLCQIEAIGDFAPLNAKRILETYEKTESDGLVAKMIIAIELRLNQNQEFKNKIEKCNGENIYVIDTLKGRFEFSEANNIFPWMNDEEWKAISSALARDRDAIIKAGEKVNIAPRLIASCLIVEQLRLFHSQRELFKKVFEPLKILGNANKISLGVMGIKEATAAKIEENLKNSTSEYYLGKDFENILDYPNGTNSEDRYARLTSEADNHYYSYLYGALYLKQMMEDWKKCGYDIKYRPEIIGTLFNVGFPQCKPKADPKVGGSAIKIGDAKYSFGSLAYEFYYSGEMLDEFPYIFK